MWACDFVGRRRLLTIGGSIQGVALFAMGIIGAASPTSPAKNPAIMDTMNLFTVGWTCGWSPNSHVLSAEILNQRLRDISYRTGSVVNMLMQFVTAFTLPYILFAPYANLKSKVGFIYGSFAVLAVVFTFFCIPGVQGRTFEEIGELFATNITLHQFRHTATGRVARSVEDVKLISNDEEVTSIAHNGTPKV